MVSVLEIPGLNHSLWLEVHDTMTSFLSMGVRQENVWEPFETSLVVSNLNEGDTFVDIGANVGYYSVIASKIIGNNGLVASYEPDEENFSLLVNNLNLNSCGNVVAVNAALADANQKGQLYLSRDNLGDHRIHECEDFRESREIDIFHAGEQLVSLDRPIDFIKIDTQGSETAITSALTDVISANRGRIKMILEFWPYGLRRAGSSGRELAELVGSLDMCLRVIDHVGLRLLDISNEDLLSWAVETDDRENNQGFINLFVS